MRFPSLASVLVSIFILEVICMPQLTTKGLKSFVKHLGCPYSGKSSRTSSTKTERQLAFDPTTQYVSTTGKYAWVAPNLAAGDQRGPCPGLNALANHGYLPHNGVADIATIITAVNTAYGMALDLGGFLAAYGAVFDGNAVGYSIGGAQGITSLLNTTGLLATPPGLSGSHNNYEADTSPTRGDLYVAGNDYLLLVDRFQQYYNALPDKSPAPQQYSALFPFRQAQFNNSISQNPYFFYPQFAGVLVSPAGYAFPAAMMANHSDEYPQGYLDKQTFKSFFAVSGNSGSFTYNPGYEKIPDNWYKRPLTNEYTIAAFVLDVLQFGLQDPRLLSIGGNTGTTNSFTGLDITNLTGGVYNAETLSQGDNLECFTFQLIQAEAPSFLASLYSNVTSGLAPLLAKIDPILANLSCPQLGGVDTSLYSQFPGYQKAKGFK